MCRCRSGKARVPIAPSSFERRASLAPQDEAFVSHVAPKLPLPLAGEARGPSRSMRRPAEQSRSMRRPAGPHEARGALRPFAPWIPLSQSAASGLDEGCPASSRSRRVVTIFRYLVRNPRRRRKPRRFHGGRAAAARRHRPVALRQDRLHHLARASSDPRDRGRAQGAAAGVPRLRGRPHHGGPSRSAARLQRAALLL